MSEEHEMDYSNSMDIRDEAYSEAMAEIERLKAEVERMTDQAIKFRDMAESHGDLLIRAADALERINALSFYTAEVDELIAELRKAAI